MHGKTIKKLWQRSFYIPLTSHILPEIQKSVYKTVCQCCVGLQLIRREEHKSEVSENLGCVPYHIVSSNLAEYEPSP